MDAKPWIPIFLSSDEQRAKIVAHLLTKSTGPAAN
jgi:hypothetical protein